jgi:phosphohistidine phosphatase
MNVNRAHATLPPDAAWTLGLMRHAKSDWEDANLSDHDRPLNARGRRDAPKMARWLTGQEFLPEVILASTAVRVRETVEGLLSIWSHQPLVMFSPSLYLSSPQTIVEHIRYEALLSDGRRPTAALVVAHNPAIERLVSDWVGTATRMPTAAVALFQCEAIDAADSQAPMVRRCLTVGRPKEV